MDDEKHQEPVISLLLTDANNPNNQDQTLTTLMGKANDVTMAGALSVATVTFSDGTTALIHEGQAIQLEDGTTAAFIQAVTDKSDPTTAKFIAGQLEDGTTVFIPTTSKDGLQALQLEAGTYIASADGLFNRDAGSLSLEQFTSADKDLLEKDDLGRIQSLSGNARISSARALALGDKAFRCMFEGCGRLYTTHHHLKVHERSHTGDRPFKCDSPGCGKAFATGYGLKSHTRVHTGEKPYKCPDDTCDKAFKTSGDLQKHVRTHTGERPFKCPFDGCDRAFTTSNIRKVHIRTHTGERPYICQEEGCGRSFASATNYKNHIRIHTGEKPYVCMVQGCGKRFTEYSSLYKHHVVHTHTKPYVCTFCGKNYRQTSTLAMHKRTSHGITDVVDDNELLHLGEEEDECDLVVNSMPKRQCIKIEDDNETIANLVIQGSTNQVMLASTALVSDDEALAALHVAGDNTIQISQHQTISPEHSLVPTSQQILVVTDPSQLVTLQQLTSQQLGETIVAVNKIDSLPSIHDKNILSTTDASITYVTE